MSEYQQLESMIRAFYIAMLLVSFLHFVLIVMLLAGIREKIERLERLIKEVRDNQ